MEKIKITRGREGHEAIGTVAWARLSSTVQSKLKNLIYPDSLSEIAPLPDDYCHEWTGKWSCPCHYVNVPKNATQFNLAVDCQDVCCVAKAVNNYTSIIQRNTGNWPKCNYDNYVEPCPVEFLTHFTGDIHQPLHVGYGFDRGGNQQQCYWYGTLTELHAVWDDSIIQKYASEVGNLASDLQNYISQNQANVQAWAQNQQTDQWANESFQFVRTVVYKFNSSSPVMAANANYIPSLGDWYYQQNLPVVKQRLAQAAVRLAVKLDNLFSQ